MKNCVISKGNHEGFKVHIISFLYSHFTCFLSLNWKTAVITVSISCRSYQLVALHPLKRDHFSLLCVTDMLLSHNIAHPSEVAMFPVLTVVWKAEASSKKCSQMPEYFNDSVMLQSTTFLWCISFKFVTQNFSLLLIPKQKRFNHQF